MVVCGILLVPVRLSSSVVDESAKMGDGVVSLYRPDKNISGTFKYVNDKGMIDEAVLGDISYFLRCRLTDETHPIDVKLLEILDEIEDHFHAGYLTIVSPFRSTLRNDLMRAGGRGVSRESLHTKGMAVDIEIGGIRPKVIRDFVYSLGQGGTGYYGERSFVHVDSGQKRSWGFRAAF